MTLLEERDDLLDAAERLGLLGTTMATTMAVEDKKRAAKLTRVLALVEAAKGFRVIAKECVRPDSPLSRTLAALADLDKHGDIEAL